MSAKPDYGIDAPGVIQSLVLIGLGLLIVSATMTAPVTISRARVSVNRIFEITGIICILESATMLGYSKLGKFRHRDRMLRQVNWRGDEQVLDVGTGRGLLLIGAAKLLASGKATGIDIWSERDLSGNSIEAALQNAELEGVRNKVELKTEDASRMSFTDNSFDVVVSNLCLHNIEDRKARENACREIVRVLKPGGIAVISDYKNTADYARILSQSGAKVQRYGAAYLYTFPPLRIVTATKSM
jgi:SAM-dependent methyltransferase